MSAWRISSKQVPNSPDALFIISLFLRKYFSSCAILLSSSGCILTLYSSSSELNGACSARCFFWLEQMMQVIQRNLLYLHLSLVQIFRISSLCKGQMILGREDLGRVGCKFCGLLDFIKVYLSRLTASRL